MSKIKITLQEIKDSMHPNLELDGRVNIGQYQEELEHMIKIKERIDKICPYVNCRNRIHCYEEGITCIALSDLKER